MKSKIMHYIKEILFFFILLTISANLISLYKSSDLNDKALEIKTIKLLDGTFFKVDTTKPILIHFWALWCPTCKVEASNIESIAKDFQVLTIAVKSGTDREIQTFLDKNSFTYKVVNDKDGNIAGKFNISAYPTTFIYDKNQNLLFSDVGYTSTWGLLFRMWFARVW